MRKLMVVMIISLLGGIMTVPADAGPVKVNQCHYTGSSNGYVLLSISEAGLNGHDGHENDGGFGDEIPNMPGFVFDSDCQPEAAATDFLVRAVSTDALGDERVIAELLDTNEDGVPSPGDTAKFYEYPTDFAGVGYTPFVGTECIIDQANIAVAEEVDVDSATDPDCMFASWIGRSVAGDAYERFRLTFSDGTSTTQVDLLDNESFFARDFIRVNNLDVLPQVSSSTNDPWLDVMFGY